MTRFKVVAACSWPQGGIGAQGGIPWHAPRDMKRFTQLTTEPMPSAVIMGRLTWQSLPHRPLKHRLNVVVSSTLPPSPEDTYWVVPSLDAALRRLADERPDVQTISVIGGARLYHDALLHPECGTVHVTYVDDVTECDCFFPFDILRTHNFTAASTVHDPVDTRLTYVDYVCSRPHAQRPKI